MKLLKRLAVGAEPVMSHVNLLNQDTTADGDDSVKESV